MRLLVSAAVLCALANPGLARSFRVTLLGNSQVITCSDRLTGKTGRPPFVRVPPLAPFPAAAAAAPPGIDPAPALFRRLYLPAGETRLAAVIPNDPRTGPSTAEYEGWMQTRYGLDEATEHRAHAAIWPYYVEERPSPAVTLAGGPGQFELALKTANAVTNFLVATRAVLNTNGGPRPDWSKFRPDYAGTATVWNVGINRRAQPGSLSTADAPQGLVVNINNRYRSGFFHVDTPTGTGWISLYWLTFP